MYLRSRSKARKPKKESPFQAFVSLVYALLSLGLVGFFVWIWWSGKRGGQPATIAPPSVATRTVTAPLKPQPSRPLPVPPLPTTETPPGEARPVETVLEAQIALVRQGISPGSIDGAKGSQTSAALAAFQRKRGLAPSGLLDDRTKSLLLVSMPLMTPYTVTTEDLARLMPVPKTWLDKSGQSRLDFENILELLGEKAFANPQLIRDLNPNVHWNQITNGTQVNLPRVDYPPIVSKAACINISLQDCVLEAFDSESNLLVHFPCSIGRLAAKRPIGELHITTVILDPNYTFDPAVFPESEEAQTVGRKLVIPPGPNNPVGVAWIGLDRPGYGIHGTPAPEQVGRTESHGCFRLANWNASYLAKLVWVGMTVNVR